MLWRKQYSFTYVYSFNTTSRAYFNFSYYLIEHANGVEFFQVKAIYIIHNVMPILGTFSVASL